MTEDPCPALYYSQQGPRPPSRPGTIVKEPENATAITGAAPTSRSITDQKHDRTIVKWRLQ